MHLCFAILDDQAEFRHSLTRMIQEHFAAFPEVNCHCQEILTLDDLCPSIDGLWPWQAIFLDIDLKDSFADLNGITIAQKLRTEGFSGEIVFTTSHLEFSPKGYEFGALRYLLKPIDVRQIKEALNQIRQRVDASCWTFYVQGQKMSIPFMNIIYIEVKNHHLYIYSLNEAGLKIRGSVTDVLKDMPAYFCLSHRSFIVNLNHVQRLSDNQLDLSAQHKVPLSRSFSGDFLRRYLSFSGLNG